VRLDQAGQDRLQPLHRRGGVGIAIGQRGVRVDIVLNLVPQLGERLVDLQQPLLQGRQATARQAHRGDRGGVHVSANLIASFSSPAWRSSSMRSRRPWIWPANLPVFTPASAAFFTKASICRFSACAFDVAAGSVTSLSETRILSLIAWIDVWKAFSSSSFFFDARPRRRD
jgi:hypothetical protein